MRTSLKRCVELPQSSHYVLHDCHVPSACLEGIDIIGLQPDVDSLVKVDLEVEHGVLKTIKRSNITNGKLPHTSGATVCNVRGAMVWPTFVDLHTHIGKSYF